MRIEAESPRVETRDPFACGLSRDVVLRLLTRTFTPQDLRLYWETAHFRRVREAAIALYGSCVLCGAADPGRLTAHHRRYTHLFTEDLHHDVVALCAKCHKRHHRR